VEADTPLDRQVAFFVTNVDRLARSVLAAADPWQAYDFALKISAVLSEALELPNTGSAYVAWCELQDLFETGKTPEADAHAALRAAAEEWLARPDPVTEQHLEAWAEHARASASALFRRDGDFWGKSRG
jgi:predicted RNase H-like HicB family nuclease